MDLEQIRRILFTFIQNKGGKVTLDYKGFNELLNVCQLKHFKKKIGLPEEYQPGLPLPRQVIEITQKITDDLRRFKVNHGDDLPVYKVNHGQAVIPSNYYIVSTLVYPAKSGDRRIEIVTDTQFADRMNSSLIKPRMRYPIANFQKSFIRIEPKEIRYIKFIYYRYPNRAQYSIALPDPDRDTPNWFMEYDPVTSVQLEWDDVNTVDIIHMMLQDLSITVEKRDLFQYANVKEVKGA